MRVQCEPFRRRVFGCQHRNDINSCRSRAYDMAARRVRAVVRAIRMRLVGVVHQQCVRD